MNFLLRSARSEFILILSSQPSDLVIGGVEWLEQPGIFSVLTVRFAARSLYLTAFLGKVLAGFGSNGVSSGAGEEHVPQSA
jgi:hypothetical protein